MSSVGCSRAPMNPARRRPDILTRPVNLQDKIYKADRVDTLGTVNFMALDAHGDLASAVSTSGIAWKYPGRVGDSPLIGAGNYCDNRYGAVACTGMGELAIRAGTARSLVLYLKLGMSLREAGLEALRDLSAWRLGRRPVHEHRRHDARRASMPASPRSRSKRYLHMTAAMAEPQLADRLLPESGAGASERAMSILVKMPQLGESVVEGTVSRWLKAPGEWVAKFEPLLEITTDKIDTEVPAPGDGILLRNPVSRGATVKAGVALAMIGERARSDGRAERAAAAAVRSRHWATIHRRRCRPDTPTCCGARVAPRPSPLRRPPLRESRRGPDCGEHGLDLADIAGTGLRGRVTKQDVEAYLARRRRQPGAGRGRPGRWPGRRGNEPD